MPPEHSRTFLDTCGLEWIVREIGSPTLSKALSRLLESDRRRGGWLVFESIDGDKRRLSPYPPDWRSMSAFEIERWCMRAIAVPPAPPGPRRAARAPEA
jgi:hypothetical protein